MTQLVPKLLPVLISLDLFNPPMSSPGLDFTVSGPNPVSVFQTSSLSPKLLTSVPFKLV